MAEMTYREKVEAKRKAMAETLIAHIESNPGRGSLGGMQCRLTRR